MGKDSPIMNVEQKGGRIDGFTTLDGLKEEY
jgi:hypothetical protein